MMPLRTIWKRPLSSACGWALLSVTAPWVAHRVCPMPDDTLVAVATAPSVLPLDLSAAVSEESCPTARTHSIPSSVCHAIPAES